jgi:hypothetical protein
LAPDDGIGAPPQAAGVSWGFDAETARRVIRSPTSRPKPDDTVSFAAAVVTYAEWGDEAPHGRVRRVLRIPPPTLDGLVVIPAAVPPPPWGFEEEQRRRQRSAFLRVGAQPEWLILPAPIVTPSAWGDVEQYIGPKLRSLWRSLVVPDEWLPFIPPPPPLVLPDGRWLDLLTSPAVGFVSIDTPLLFPYQGEIGFSLYVTVASTHPNLSLVFGKPSGTTLRVDPPMVYRTLPGVFPTQPQAHLCYISRPGDFDEVGLWSVHVEAGEVAISGNAYFPVLMAQ